MKNKITLNRKSIFISVVVVLGSFVFFFQNCDSNFQSVNYDTPSFISEPKRESSEEVEVPHSQVFPSPEGESPTGNSEENESEKEEEEPNSNENENSTENEEETNNNANLDAPEVPSNFRASLVSNDWAEFAWNPTPVEKGKPPIDAYVIYRDGEKISQINRVYDANKFDELYWKNKVYMDCNYTKIKPCIKSHPKEGAEHEYQISALAGGKESKKSEPLNVKFHSPKQTLFDKSGYQAIFVEDFNDKKLDPNKWNTNLPWKDRVINKEQQYFVDHLADPNFGYNPFKFTDTSLVIEGIKTPENLKEKANGQPYLSGALTTVDKYDFTFGYVEARMKLASTMGALSSFFLLNKKYNIYDKENPGNEHEIDIVEFLAQNPKVAYQTYHYHRLTEELEKLTHSSPTMVTKKTIGNYYDQFHTYSILWEPEKVVWFIDGQEIKQISGESVGWQDVSIFTYLVLGSAWAVTPPEDAVFPAKLEIDYIHVYKKKN